MAVAGCGDPHADMGEQSKYATYAPSEFFADGASARALPPGVVARDEARSGPSTKWDQKRSDESANSDAIDFNSTIPFPVTLEAVRNGAEAFNTYCAVCHGRLGNGEGMIVQRGFTRPPSFHVPRLRQAPDAHFYNVITHGYGAMFSYNERVTPAQRWEIVAYIRALQAAPDKSSQPISNQDREALIAGGDRKTPTAGGGG
jgi:mono/diheme cytochrome c family protein